MPTQPKRSKRLATSEELGPPCRATKAERDVTLTSALNEKRKNESEHAIGIKDKGNYFFILLHFDKASKSTSLLLNFINTKLRKKKKKKKKK